MKNRLRLCNSRKCCISIWSTWYSLFIVLIHIFLTKNHVHIILKLYNEYEQSVLASSGSVRAQSWLEHEIKWWEHESSSSTVFNNQTQLDTFQIQSFPIFKNNLYYELLLRVILTSSSVLVLILFFIFSLKKVGNFSNDGVKFGRDFFCEKLHHHHKHYNHLNEPEIRVKNYDDESLTTDSASSTESSTSPTRNSDLNKSKTCCSRFLNLLKSFLNLIQLCWRHFLPLNSFLHLISILLLLIPDMIYEPANFLLKELNNANNRSCSDLSSANTSFCLVDKLYNPTDGVFAKLRINIADVNSHIEQTYFYLQIQTYKFELISFCLAFLTISIRYGAVFWYTNKVLSYLITLVGLTCAVQQLMQLYTFVYISKQIMVNQLANSLLNLIYTKMYRSDTEDLIPKFNLYNNYYIINNKLKLLFLYSILSILVLLTLIPVYVFSYLKYKERFLIEESLFLRSILNEPRKLNDLNIKRRKSSMAKLDKINFLDHKLERHLSIGSITFINQNKSCCFNYCPHLVATIQLILICSCKLPFCYDIIIYFNTFKDFGLMISIIVEILHTIILLFIWLILTLKTEWNMHLRTSFSICHWTYHLKLNEKTREPDELVQFRIRKNSAPLDEQIRTISDKVDGIKEIPLENSNVISRKLSNSDYYLNSETLYRNEIRKSIKNILQPKRNSVVTPVMSTNQTNKAYPNTDKVYYSQYGLQEGQYMSAHGQVKHVYNNLAHVSVVEIPINRTNSFIQQQSARAQTKPVLYLNRAPSKEYESRV